jgi:hypothetical protein
MKRCATTAGAVSGSRQLERTPPFDHISDDASGNLNARRMAGIWPLSLN